MKNNILKIDQQIEKAADNKGLPKAGVTNFFNTFVLNRTLVFQMNGSAEMPRHRLAPNRWCNKNK